LASAISQNGRVVIQGVTPQIDGGRYAAKAVVGEDVVVAADIFREGHDKVAAVIRFRGPSDRSWREAPLTLDSNDRWYGTFHVDVNGPWRYTISAWTDHYASWLDGLQKKHAAGIEDLSLELADGRLLLQRRAVREDDREPIDRAIERFSSDATNEEKVAVASDPLLLRALQDNPERLDTSTHSPELPLWVDRERAQFSAWYELFPRSEGATVEEGFMASGTFADAAKRLPAVAEMGFDVLYLPPIHPIGRTNRKGATGPHDLDPGPHDPGVPWAIGSEDGGHDAIHPDLGTFDDFDDFVAEANRLGLEVALDFAIQCSPDHPWVTEHPEWFKHRADGSIAYAENPPKKYQDIYPIDFDTDDLEGLYLELRRIVELWISHGIKIFRVDNPHTKALPFWEWLIAELRAEHPDLIFLAEAFTRPKMMQTLAKLGFNQSYTYFAWRNERWELVEYMEELARGPMADYYRPNFWPNTPDILTEFLQEGGRPAFELRLVLAALLSPSYGIYSGYELAENTPLHEGSEEYLHSEKYTYRPRDWDHPASLAPSITRINRIRREHAVFRELRNIWFHPTTNDQLLCFSKVGRDRTTPVLVVVNLDPHHAQEGIAHLDLWQLGLEGVGPFEAHDLMTGTAYVWHGADNYVRLDPQIEAAHVLSLRAL
jgi:starch synthase (maltosyl-transferring)